MSKGAGFIGLERLQARFHVMGARRVFGQPCGEQAGVGQCVIGGSSA